jgi:drug/metabolite transporter (DMT)-like permease
MNTPEPIPVVDAPLAAVAEPAVTVAPAESSRRAVVMLVLVTALWGISFPVMKNWQDASHNCPGGAVVASATVISLRMFLAIPLLLLARPRALCETTRAEHAAGALVGLTFFVGFIMQVIGLAWITPARSAFFTSLGCVWVPLLAWLVHGTRVSGITWAGIIMGLAGATILSGVDLDVSGTVTVDFGVGEALTIASSVLFAVQILLLDRLGKRVRSAHITFAFVGVTAVAGAIVAIVEAARGPGVALWFDWLAGLLRNTNILVDLSLLTVLCTFMAFQWMNQYQPQIAASRAALIYLLEPVFAWMFSVIWGHDQITLRLLLGGLVILNGNLLVELPGFLRERLRNR